MKSISTLQKSAIFVTSLMFVSGFSHAQEAATPEPETGGLQWVASLGITFGGDDLVEVEYEDLDLDDELEAGGLIYLGAGANYDFRDSPFSIRGIFGYHFDSVDADNGEGSLDRTFIDVIGFYRLGNHRIGVGLTQHFSPNFDVDIDGGIDESFDFDSASGVLLEYNYVTSDQVAIGIRYTDIDYELDESGFLSETVDASHAGIFIIGFF